MLGAHLKSHQNQINYIGNDYLKLFVTKKVRDILFAGSNDYPPNNNQKLSPPFVFFCGSDGTDYPDGVWNIFTGAGDNSKMGKVC